MKNVTEGANRNLNYQRTGGLRIYCITKKSCINVCYLTKKLNFWVTSHLKISDSSFLNNPDKLFCIRLKKMHFLSETSPQAIQNLEYELAWKHTLFLLSLESWLSVHQGSRRNKNKNRLKKVALDKYEEGQADRQHDRQIIT